MKHGDKAKAKSAKAKASSKEKSVKAGAKAVAKSSKGAQSAKKVAAKAPAEKSSKSGGAKAPAPPPAAKTGGKAAAKAPSKAPGKAAAGGNGPARANVVAAGGFTNPVVASAFKRAIKKFPNAFRKLTAGRRRPLPDGAGHRRAAPRRLRGVRRHAGAPRRRRLAVRPRQRRAASARHHARPRGLPFVSRESPGVPLRAADVQPVPRRQPPRRARRALRVLRGEQPHGRLPRARREDGRDALPPRRRASRDGDSAGDRVSRDSGDVESGDRPAAAISD